MDEKLVKTEQIKKICATNEGRRIGRNLIMGTG